MKQTDRIKMYQDIERHGNQLNAIFNTGKDPVKLCKQLHSLEIQANRLATDYCNGVIQTEQWEDISDKVLDKLDKILAFRKADIPVFFNGDARGFSLKIDDDYMRDNKLALYTDWGGYGIIAPDFTPAD